MLGNAYEVQALGEGRYQVEVSCEPVYFSGARLKVLDKRVSGE